MSQLSAACGDPALPFLGRALDRDAAFAALAPLVGQPRELQLKAVRVMRYKPARRCLLTYDFAHASDPAAIRIVGKIRARGPDRRAFAINRALWNAGFQPGKGAAFVVPEPLGIVRDFHMFVQRWVPGETAETAFDGARGVGNAREIALALHALHGARVVTDRTHTLDDELRLLSDLLARFSAARPSWAPRIENVVKVCGELARKLPESRRCGIHRDFYPAQVILGRQGVAILDLDLYASGDPALDVGNFLAHMTERSIRRHGSPSAYAASEECFERTYSALAPDVAPEAIHAYTTLALARHVYLSTTFSDRTHTTSLLLACVEERLAGLEV